MIQGNASIKESFTRTEFSGRVQGRIDRMAANLAARMKKAGTVAAADDSGTIVDETRPLFNPASRQLTLLYHISRVFHWEWDMDAIDFQDAAGMEPKGPFKPLQAPVLVPYMSKDVRATVERLLWAVEHLHFGRIYRTGAFNAGWETVEVDSAIQHRPGLAWEVVDFGSAFISERDRSQTAPHAAILAAILLHPEWAKATGITVPAVVIPGYRMRPDQDDRNRGSCRPTLGVQRQTGCLQFGTTFGLEPEKGLAFPRVTLVSLRSARVASSLQELSDPRFL